MRQLLQYVPLQCGKQTAWLTINLVNYEMKNSGRIQCSVLRFLGPYELGTMNAK